MGQVVNIQLGVNGIRNAVHGADRAVHKAKVRLKYQMIHICVTSGEIYRFIIQAAARLSMKNIFSYAVVALSGYPCYNMG